MKLIQLQRSEWIQLTKSLFVEKNFVLQLIWNKMRMAVWCLLWNRANAFIPLFFTAKFTSELFPRIVYSIVLRWGSQWKHLRDNQNVIMALSLRTVSPTGLWTQQRSTTPWRERERRETNRDQQNHAYSYRLSLLCPPLSTGQSAHSVCLINTFWWWWLTQAGRTWRGSREYQRDEEVGAVQMQSRSSAPKTGRLGVVIPDATEVVRYHRMSEST